MPNQGQSIAKPQHSDSPQDASSNLAQQNPVSHKSWLLRALCVVVIGASCLWISCGGGSEPLSGGPLDLTQCPNNLASDTLAAYAQKCSAAIGVDVPAFNCDDGTPVPENHLTGVFPDQLCDAPNVLVHQCDPSSRFQILKQTDEVAIVAHCRKQGNADGFYGDIAVIQYNKTNGATCFYQALGSSQPQGNLPAQTTAPSEGNDPGQGKFPWFDPSMTASINCHQCHDNGPFIRSPYLAQLRDEPTNRLPGTHIGSGAFDNPGNWNKTIPYKFIGNDFQTWKVYSVTPTGTGSGCLQCHRLGISSSHGQFLSDFGTAQTLGIIATATQQDHKNPHSPDSPIWMKPMQVFYDQTAALQALAASSCAHTLVKRGNGDDSGIPLPEGCEAREYGQGDTCTSIEGR